MAVFVFVCDHENVFSDEGFEDVFGDFATDFVAFPDADGRFCVGSADAITASVVFFIVEEEGCG